MRTVLGLLAAAVLLTVRADTVVSDVVVNQRWPWSERVDVDFILTGDSADVKVTAVWDGRTEPYELGTVCEAKPGRGRLTWDPAESPFAGKTLTGFSVAATPVALPANRYLIIDLANGGVSYAPRPDGADGKWSDAYKTTKMVFRRIPAGTYPLGMASNLIAQVAGFPVVSAYATAWQRHDITFTSDFYVGVYKMTVAQYKQLTEGDSGSNLQPKAVSYDELRGSTEEGANWPGLGYAVSTNSLIHVLRTKAGTKDFIIDLCQECQWEAAMRAGQTTIWPNGGTEEDSAPALTNIAERIAWLGGKHDVGLKDDNGWGIFDPVGLGSEWALDKSSKGDGTLPKNGISSCTDPIGSTTAYADFRLIRGGGGKKLFDVLPCRRFVCGHGDVAAAARFCIHLQPLVSKP